ncbi:hypothetical protein GcM1_239042 [Golovinomyces cichoracearum]|uniref:Trafficking protein particle complex II-specific subunit 65 IgD3 domain-containing protein n=1 Tax=Golovinomyces cichoracearum TaxID=62708 RepID=A0A420IIS0_9PEZI|nr:hypothetical protein GcM1_239042 [Golovinomyces cichoracearum]
MFSKAVMINETKLTDTENQVPLDLVQNSLLTACVPEGNISFLKELLQDTVQHLDKESKSPLESIPQRQVLFLDEIFNVYAILQTTYFNEETLHSYLERLTISIEGQVLNSIPGNTNDSPANEIIFTQPVQDVESPLFVTKVPCEADNANASVNIYTVWKISMFLDRAKIRFQSSSILFSAKATLRPLKVKDTTVNDGYLPSQSLSSINLLEAFGNDSLTNGVKPRLSALRVSRVIPAIQPSSNSACMIRSTSPRSIRVYPAINAKVKYSRFVNDSNNVGVVASVEVDITPFADPKIIINEVKLHLKDGRVEDFSAKSGLTLPVTSLPLESLSFTYLLSPNESDKKTSVRDLEISIIALVNLSDDCQPLIDLHWITSLSFTPPVNPGFGAPTSSVKLSHKRNQLSIDVGTSGQKTAGNHSFITRYGSITPVSAPIGNELSPSVADFGITVTFTSSSTSSPIYPCVPFYWNAFIINRSFRPRKLSLIFMPTRPPVNERINSNTSYSLEDRELRVADAVLDENTVYAIQKRSSKATELISLTTKQNIGPLSPMACHEVELEFVALDSGTIQVEAVRILDLDTQVYYDVTDLPIIYVSPTPEP